MANVTRIKAHDPAKPKDEEKPKKVEKPAKKPFILFRPFVALGRYIHNSWLEIRQVRWPNRKSTWQMVIAVLVYTAIFIAFIMLLDALFKWLFSTVIQLS